ncbi:tRNA pseudouridine(38-40) synthase TruA [Corticibacter populi]|uniref:tRNA pseudouridine synthase A n=1 Tax=Corticibacter populi TaxID=1550736 RepID=A0A3M6QYP3_9BURK|nr:tRNA pseudouridine(38-40) synthase TruA [Corticibacter populi]RMX08013.1 tRNA pseudouridine(38-40) synthase TruA [Corticibacter populi]RZS35256.1 tRNA pseudouridine38-40 synthase [Corticibacter populi]
MRIALGISYHGQHYHGWQSQPDGQTVQDRLEHALATFIGSRVSTLCAGRTDTGVHGLMQVVHFDSPVQRTEMSWVRGTNRFLPADIAVQWAREVPDDFHARNRAESRRYAYVLLQSAVRPSIDAGRVGWTFLPLDGEGMREAARHLLGEHDFSSFRAAACQSHTPVKTLHAIRISASPLRSKHPPAGSDARAVPTCYWRFEFEANAFLHHMIRNIMGCLIAVGQGHQRPEWMRGVLQARSRDAAAPTFAPDGLYFLGPRYAPRWDLPDSSALFDFLPGANAQDL